eukprot:scaffold90929_cov30-Tisochrysis_lutea.AAC.5
MERAATAPEPQSTRRPSPHRTPRPTSSWDATRRQRRLVRESSHSAVIFLRKPLIWGPSFIRRRKCCCF